MERIEGFSAWLSCYDDYVANMLKGSGTTHNPCQIGLWSKHPLSLKAHREILGLEKGDWVESSC